MFISLLKWKIAVFHCNLVNFLRSSTHFVHIDVKWHAIRSKTTYHLSDRIGNLKKAWKRWRPSPEVRNETLKLYRFNISTCLPKFDNNIGFSLHFQISNNCYSIYDDGNVESIFATGWIECGRIGMCAHFTRWGTVIGIRSHIEFISSWRIVSGKNHSFLAINKVCMRLQLPKVTPFIGWLNIYWRRTRVKETSIKDEGERNALW